ncbi:MAG TPA: hypothetical protein VN715_02485 [Roseiarcus sp.]|nr:hypothetical protein [Roseiarcus sp.]
MRKMLGGAWVAAVLLAAGVAQAQTATPPDPLAPGAAAESAKPEKADKAGAEKVDKEKVDAEKADAEKAARPAHERARHYRHHEAEGLAISVHNERSVGLMQLSVVPAGDPDHKKVLSALAFGRKAVVHVKHTKDCLYDIRAHFADGADTEQLGVDLCKDKTINLTD